MTRVDVDADGNGCETKWQNQVRSSAVPHLSIADGNIYTMVRQGLDTTTPLDGFAYAVLDPETGAVKTTRTVTGTLLGDTLQMSALITDDGRYMQGTISGIVSIAPAPVVPVGRPDRRGRERRRTSHRPNRGQLHLVVDRPTIGACCIAGL